LDLTLTNAMTQLSSSHTALLPCGCAIYKVLVGEGTLHKVTVWLGGTL